MVVLTGSSMAGSTAFEEGGEVGVKCLVVISRLVIAALRFI